MSSSEQVRISYIEELVYNATPGSGNFTQARITDDSLSGTPNVTESAEITGDGQPTGQIIVGQDTGGGINSQLSGSVFHNDMLEAMMRSTWSATLANTPAVLTIDATAKTITGTGTTFITDGFAIGDLVQLGSFTDAANEGEYVWITALTETVITYGGSSTLVDETGGGDETVTRPARVGYGTTDVSYAICKEFQDLTNKSISYNGMRVSGANLSFNYGSPATAAYTFAGAGHAIPALPITDSRTVDSGGTEDPLNSSGDVGTIVVDGAVTTYCIEQLGLQLDNGALPHNCVGSLTPANQTLTGLSLNVNMDVYLADGNFDLHSKKLTQTPISVSYTAIDSAGKGFGVQIPAVQLSFPDANAAGRRQINKLSLAGVAKKDATVGQTIYLYKLV